MPGFPGGQYVTNRSVELRIMIALESEHCFIKFENPGHKAGVSILFNRNDTESSTIMISNLPNRFVTNCLSVHTDSLLT